MRSIVFHEVPENTSKRNINKKTDGSESKSEKRNKLSTDKSVTDTVTDTETDTTGSAKNGNIQCSWVNHDEEIASEDFLLSKESDVESNISPEVEILDICSRNSKEFAMYSNNAVPQESEVTNESELMGLTEMLNSKGNVPEEVLWPSILSALESCTDYDQLLKTVLNIKGRIPPLKGRVDAAKYVQLKDSIDCIAQKEIPADGPCHLKAIATLGDGNCLCRALSRAFFNDDRYHIEIRVRILLEAVINQDKYLSDEYLR